MSSPTSQRRPSAPAPLSPGITVRKAPFPIALILLLAAVTLTVLSVYVPDLIHVTEVSPGPTHFETKYGLYRRCTRKTPTNAPLPSNTITALIPQAESIYLLERAHPADQAPLKSVERLQGLLQATRVAAAAGKGRVGERENIRGRRLDDPIDGEGDAWVCTPFPQNSECERFGQKFCILWSTAGYAAQLALVPCVVALITLLVITVGIGSRKVRAKRRRGGWKIVSILMGTHAVLQTLSVGLIIHVYRTDERFRAGKSHLDRACDFAVVSAVISVGTVGALTLTGVAAEAGKTWAAGKSAKHRARGKHHHRRTRSGRVVAIPSAGEGAEVVVDEETSLIPGGGGEGEGRDGYGAGLGGA